MSDRQNIDCPNCSAVVEFDGRPHEQMIICEACEHEFDSPATGDANDARIEIEIDTQQGRASVDQPVNVSVDSEQTNSNSLQSDTANEQQEAAHQKLLDRLPPKFMAVDPDWVDHSYRRESSKKIIFPDGKGGVQSVDSNIVKIQHKGETIELVALPPEVRRKRQRLVNIVSIAIGVVFLVLFFSWLNR